MIIIWFAENVSYNCFAALDEVQNKNIIIDLNNL